MAKSLISRLHRWVEQLPDELRFQGIKSTSEQGGLAEKRGGTQAHIRLTPGFLHLLYLPVRFLVTRPFMRISFQLPERFANVSVGAVAWAKVEAESREAIEWVDKNEHILEGWFVSVYAFFICSLVQVRLHEPGPLSLSLALTRDRDTVPLAHQTAGRSIPCDLTTCT